MLLSSKVNALNKFLYSNNHRCFSKMPKRKKQPNKPESTNAGSVELPQVSPVTSGPNDRILIKLHVKPGAKQSAVTGVTGDALDVQIAAPPVDGEANTELIRYMADVLGLKRSNIVLEKGAKSREKIISVTGTSLGVENILQILKSSSEKF